MDKIEITYVEFDNDRGNHQPVGGLFFVEWRRDQRQEHAFSERETFAGRDGEVQGIPDDVRVALALLVAPGLVVAVPMSVEE